MKMEQWLHHNLGTAPKCTCIIKSVIFFSLLTAWNWVNDIYAGKKDERKPLSTIRYYCHCPHSMRSRVYETGSTVCLSQHGRTAANQLLQVCCCGPSNRLLQQRTNAGSATLSVYVGSWTQTCLNSKYSAFRKGSHQSHCSKFFNF